MDKNRKRDDKDMLEYKDIIIQKGHINCPICGNSFDWKYKLRLLITPELESKNRAETYIDDTPSGSVTHITSTNGKVRFMVNCGKCRTRIETEEMELINK